MMIDFSINLESLFYKQTLFQKMLGVKDIPTDNPDMLAHHLLGLVTEIGEVAQADKRWKKNKRNDHYDREEKLKEIADCFIFLINICLYSNFGANEVLNAVHDKINENIARFQKTEEHK